MQSGENFSIWLIGDTGAVQTDGHDPVMKMLHNSITGHQKGIIVFLGDLIYPKGLPEIGHVGREQAEKIMRSQLSAVEAFQGKLYFLSGNHDWKKGSAGGWKYARRLAHFIHEALGRKEVCMPVSAGPGPELVEPYPGLFLIFLNTQWWMQPGEIKDERGKIFFRDFRKMLTTLPPDKTLIMGHHPVRSHSLHGGKFKKRHHLFPLKLYGYRQGPPIPILGSLLVWYRKFIGAKEDMASPKYAWFKAQMLDMLEDFPGITYVSGHEHNLQWIQDEGINHIISGAGSKAYYVKSGKGTRFASKSKGFIELIWQNAGVVGFRAHEWDKNETSKITEMNWKQE
jgi:hypothetical protein